MEVLGFGFSNVFAFAKVCPMLNFAIAKMLNKEKPASGRLFAV
jgi:hypothetical protein